LYVSLVDFAVVSALYAYFRPVRILASPKIQISDIGAGQMR